MTNKTAPILPKVDLETHTQSFFRDSTFWVEEHWLQILIASGVAFGIVLLLHLVRSWGTRLCRRGHGVANWYAIFGRAVAKTSNFFIIMVAIRLVTTYADPPAAVVTTSTFLFTIAAVFQAAIWAREVIFGLIEHRTSGEDERAAGLASALGIIRLLVTFVLFAIALVMVLSNLGVNVTGLVAGLGVGGIAIGLAAQGIFGDLIAALSILFDRPFRVGHNISYDQTTGTVEGIGLKSTRIRSFDGELRIISNRQLLDKEIQNISDRNHIRLKFMLGVAYETPPDTLDRIPEMLRQIAEAHGGNAVRGGFAAFGASTLDYEYIVEMPSGDWPTAHAARDRIATDLLRHFTAAGIAFAYPTQTSYAAAPDGTIIMPYPDVQPVMRVDKEPGER
ncbi:mechanosensitive ion channel family protein [Sphingomonas hengshuiensis]|uniref:Mechanosensitive ion channel protein MscS n=1 Tax=Sphingomonas hengshuiensis TaxID=1609977 RepID=A0A7U5BET9_9SPHN|nr:mechanosensitive ion channel family protein [Sphingomonas hengshuiensis]AJP70976.1 mechanosensitive ion channel protein MscS [Sphingomonas hengshuiensis]